MPQVTFLGHPLHPQLIVMPAGLLPFSFVLDLLHLATKNRSFANASYYTMLGGIAAGTAGAMDYETIPRDHHTKRLGRLHGMMNVGLLTLTALNVVMRRHHRTPRTLPVLLSLLGNAGLLVSAWYGGHLVYHHGMRVRGTDLSGSREETKLPGDEELTQALIATTDGEGKA